MLHCWLWCLVFVAPFLAWVKTRHYFPETFHMYLDTLKFEFSRKNCRQMNFIHSFNSSRGMGWPNLTLLTTTVVRWLSHRSSARPNSNKMLFHRIFSTYQKMGLFLERFWTKINFMPSRRNLVWKIRHFSALLFLHNYLITFLSPNFKATRMNLVKLYNRHAHFAKLLNALSLSCVSFYRFEIKPTYIVLCTLRL